MVDEPNLNRRSGRRDLAAFYDATAPRAYRMALRLCGDEARASALVGAAYRQVWAHRGTPDLGDARERLELLICVAAGTTDPPPQSGLPGWSRLSTVQRQILELVVCGRWARPKVARELGMTLDTLDDALRAGLLLLRNN